MTELDQDGVRPAWIEMIECAAAQFPAKFEGERFGPLQIEVPSAAASW